MFRAKRYLLVGVPLIIIAIVALGFWYVRDSLMTKGFALRQETPDWAEWKKKLPPSADGNSAPNVPNSYPTSGVLMRFLDARREILLLRHSIGDGVYSYDTVRHSAAKVSDDDWQKAVEEVTVCEDQRWSRPLAFNFDNINYRLLSMDDSKSGYPTYGKYAVDAIVSPTKQKAAVLSAAGPKKPYVNFGLPGLGGSDVEIYGQRYFQIMDLVTKELDQPVVLRSENEVPCFSACWSSDERILVAYQCNFSDFQVVEPFH